MSKPDHISCRPGTTDAMERLAKQAEQLEAENKRLKNDIEGNKRTIAKLKADQDKKATRIMELEQELLAAQKRAASEGDKARSYKHQMMQERKRAEDAEVERDEFEGFASSHLSFRRAKCGQKTGMFTKPLYAEPQPPKEADND